jgi:hypothetical protein
LRKDLYRGKRNSSVSDNALKSVESTADIYKTT